MTRTLPKAASRFVGVFLGILLVTAFEPFYERGLLPPATLFGRAAAMATIVALMVEWRRRRAA